MPRTFDSPISVRSSSSDDDDDSDLVAILDSEVEDDESYTNDVRNAKYNQLVNVRDAAQDLDSAQDEVRAAQQEIPDPTGDDRLCTDIVLKQYQCGPAFHLLRNPRQRGIACFFKPGYGKTLTAVALSVLFLSRGIINKIIAVTPKSLRVNIKMEFKKCGSPAALRALKNMTVYTYESMHKKHDKILADRNTLLICDEAHRLRESNTKVFKAMENLAGRCGKVLAMTATPFVNRINDIMNLLHIIDPDVPTKHQKSAQVTTDELMRYARNLVAFPDEDISELFANRHDMPVVRCPLDDLQIIELLKYDKKLGITKETKRKSKAGAAEGDDDAAPLNRFLLEDLEVPVEVRKKNSYLVQTRQLSLGIYKRNGDEVIASTKVLKLFEELNKRVDGHFVNLPALVFTAFLNKGVHYIVNVAEQVFRKTGTSLRIGVITGDVKEAERNTIVQQMNSGEFDVVILSDAGSEGLNFMGIRSVHIVNMEWNPAVTEQQIGRALRINAHAHLPPEKRVVNIYMYKSEIPEGLTSFQGTEIRPQSCIHTEQRLYDIQMEKAKQQKRAMEALHEVAIQHDCTPPPPVGDALVPYVGSSSSSSSSSSDEALELYGRR